MKLPLMRWIVVYAVCVAIFALIDQIVYRKAMPLLLTGFIIGQAVMWALRSPKISN